MDFLMHPTYFPHVLSMAAVVQGPVRWEVRDNYQKQTYRNRCYIATDRGRLMLNIPIRHVGGKTGRQRFREVRIDNSYPWQRQHWRSLETAYRSAPFFEYYETELKPLFETRYDRLLELNLATIEKLCDLLQVPFPKGQTATYRPPEGEKEDLRFLVQAKGGMPVSMPPYTQVFQERHGFLPDLSTLDLLFNEGTATRDYLASVQLPWHG